MKYLSWAAFYEGNTDALYLDVLLPRVIRDLIASHGTDIVEMPDNPVVRLGCTDRGVGAVAREACSYRDAFDLLFVHADTGGRGLERNLGCRSTAYCSAIRNECEWQDLQCVTVTPRHETEAWLLADVQAIAETFGYEGDPAAVGLPMTAREAERLNDPKSTLEQAATQIIGHKRNSSIVHTFPSIGQRQRLPTLRTAQSFVQFEQRLLESLRALRFIL